MYKNEETIQNMDLKIKCIYNIIKLNHARFITQQVGLHIEIICLSKQHKRPLTNYEY